MSKKLFLTDVKSLRRQARQHMDEGTVTGSLLRDRETVLKLLKDALATEIVCVLHYRRHHFMARDLCTKSMADEFLDHASEEQEHANQIAERIVQLGGDPDFTLDGLISRSYSAYGEGESISDMIKEELIVERIAIDSYRDMLRYIGERDLKTSRMLKEILAAEEVHAERLENFLQGLPAGLKRSEPLVRAQYV